MTHDSLPALDAAVTAFRRHLEVVTGDDWTVATPCPGWDVHHLVAHVVGGNRFAAMVLERHTAAEAMAAVMGTTQLGAEPITDFDGSVAAQQAAFGREGALARIVDHPLGRAGPDDDPMDQLLDLAGRAALPG